MITNRQKHILKILIKIYSKTGKPISSSNMADYIKLSPSMLRNELQVLEENKLITKSYLSSGRIPTNKGYKFIIDDFSIEDESNAFEDTEEEHYQILLNKINEIFLQRTKSIDEVLNQSVDLISNFTKMIFLEENTYDSVFLQDVKFYELSDKNLNFVFVFSNGEIQNKIMKIENNVDDLVISLKLFANKMIGSNIKDIYLLLETLSTKLDHSLKAIEKQLNELILKILNNLVYKDKAISNVNSLVNYFDSMEDIFFFKEIFSLIQTENIWNLLKEIPFIQKDNTRFFLDLETNKMENNSLIKRDFNFVGHKKSFLFIGHKNQNYEDILKLFSFIETKIKEF